MYGKHYKPKHSKTRTKSLAKNMSPARKHANISENKNETKKSAINSFLNKKIVKKNQVVLVATALMVCSAGYMNYTNNTKMASLGDAQLVSANVVETKNDNIEEAVNEEVSSTSAIVPNDDNNKVEEIEKQTNTELKEDTNTISTSANTEDEYYTKTRLERDTMYSQMLETYQKILENNNIPNDQKSIASNEIKNINDKKNSIATMENLLKTKEIQEAVILYNDSSVNVIVKTDKELTKDQVAQITNIVTRESGVDIEDIHVSEKK